LFTQVLRRSSHHQPSDEHREDERDHPVQAGSRSAEDHLSGHDVPHRDARAEAGVGLDSAVDGAIAARGAASDEERRSGDTEALLFTFHVAADGGRDDMRVQPGGVLDWRAVRLPCIHRDGAADE